MAQKQKLLNVGGVRKYDEEKVFFFKERTFSSFKIASVPKWKGAKYVGGSRPSCCRTRQLDPHFRLPLHKIAYVFHFSHPKHDILVVSLYRSTK